MSDIKSQQCPNCGGVLVYDPKKGKMVCEYCRSVFEIPEEKNSNDENDRGYLSGFDFKALRDKLNRPDAEALPVYHCSNCGADVLAAPEQMSLTCPYCRNHIVITGKSSGSLRPDGIVPFKITAGELPDLLTKFYKDKVLLPKDYFSNSRMGGITGIYVPFWIFSGSMSGEMNFEATITNSHREGDYDVKNIDHYSLDRNVDLSFDSLAIDASEKIKDVYMDSVCPFDLSEAKPFDTGYLSGFAADRFDVDTEDMMSRAEAAVERKALPLIMAQARAGYDTVTYRSGKLTADMDAKYLLLPVYLFQIEYDGQKYDYAVNGQTGSIIGHVPTGKRESGIYFWVRMLAVIAAVILFTFIKYMMGA